MLLLVKKPLTNTQVHGVFYKKSLCRSVVKKKNSASLSLCENFCVPVRATGASPFLKKLCVLAFLREQKNALAKGLSATLYCGVALQFTFGEKARIF